AASRGVFAADAFEPAGCIARGGFFGSGTRRATGRRDGRGDDGGQRAEPDPAGAAARRAGSDGTTSYRDGRDRRGDFHVRQRGEAAGSESGRRATVGALGGEIAGIHGG